MKKKTIIISVIAAIAATGLFYGYNHVEASTKITAEEDQSVNIPDLKSWPEASQKAAKEMEAKYGKPNEATADMLVWNNNGIWLKTIVYKKEMDHNFPKPHKDVIEQWVNYSIPLTNYDELAQYDGSITANRTNGTISSRCDKEAMNMLAINLAYDIVNNSRTVDEARIDYGKNAMAFMNGEKPGYTQKLNFINDKTAPDPDKAIDMDTMKNKIGMEE